jgi:hypothetical protein
MSGQDLERIYKDILGRKQRTCFSVVLNKEICQFKKWGTKLPSLIMRKTFVANFSPKTMNLHSSLSFLTDAAGMNEVVRMGALTICTEQKEVNNHSGLKFVILVL